MRVNKRAMLAAGLIAGAAALTGCTADMMPTATPTPQAAEKATASPATAQPTASAAAEAPSGTETGEEAPIGLLVSGKEVTAGAAKEQDGLLLPLLETAEALGYKTDSRQTEEETQTKRVITLEKDESRITVSYAVSDNTIRSVTWQKDGLLIPVDARITTIRDIVYVPSAFFEEAADVRVSETETGVTVSLKEPVETPQTAQGEDGENG